MIVFKKVLDLQTEISRLRSAGRTIGFVPTMGALHLGHISLIERSKKECDCTVVSIFINPTQFNNTRDFEKYPRLIEKDSILLEEAKADILFLPSTDEMYENHQLGIQSFEIGYLDTILEGTHRPGHYRGVVTIVEKLLIAVSPDKIYLGLKDYQQVKVIEKLILEKGISTEVVGCPTLRDSNGLALSSRNMRLSENGKKIALQLSHCLKYIVENKGIQSPEELIQSGIKRFLQDNDIKLEYLEIRNAHDLSEVNQLLWNKSILYVALIAAWVEGVRLIDNMEM